jgi:hypothetical protein
MGLPCSSRFTGRFSSLLREFTPKRSLPVVVPTLLDQTRRRTQSDSIGWLCLSGLLGKRGTTRERQSMECDPVLEAILIALQIAAVLSQV